MPEIDYDQLYYAYKLLWEAGREVEEADIANNGESAMQTTEVGEPELHTQD